MHMHGGYKLVILMCNGEYILCKIAQKIIIDKIEEIAMEVGSEVPKGRGCQSS